MNIPRVQTWRVTFMREGKQVATVHVDTVSRLFARMLALEEFPAGALLGTYAKVSAMRQNPCKVRPCMREPARRMA